MYNLKMKCILLVISLEEGYNVYSIEVQQYKAYISSFISIAINSSKAFFNLIWIMG